MSTLFLVILVVAIVGIAISAALAIVWGRQADGEMADETLLSGLGSFLYELFFWWV